ncbi:MAG TPA: alpha-ketoglutarate-dependent dioxygenase AlkB [Gemmatimonadales bacterium]|nr:alpha-ketoglutarate-dependent dioxygenase AlkB [Gemmatimonadales bacterium]
MLPDAELPQGFKYSSEAISPGEEQGLLERIRELPLAEFQFHGFTAKRRVISYGWNYDFEAREVREVEAIPSWLLPLRERAAAFAGILPDQLQQALVMEYDVGAAIGWHRDKAVFGDVIGVSLLSACRFRLRRKVGAKWERASLVADARSAYLLRGPARTEWEHSIPGVDALRYSVTFRSFSEQVRH